MTPLTPRGTELCRGCGAPDLTVVLDLGLQPLSNDMGMTPEQRLPTFPLVLSICGSCGLGQVGEYVLPERIFGEAYPYLSSTSAAWLAHARTFAERMTVELALGPEQHVVEVASNDGYLLSAFQSLGVAVLGIEPARNVAQIAEASGVPTVRDFFGRTVGKQVAEEIGQPRLVVANNVMAHVPDLEDFIGGFDAMCGDHTLVTIENPSLLTLLLGAQFDTIYHEHFSYLTAHSVRSAVEPHGLELVHVEKLTTHGGSNRYHLRRAGTAEVGDSVRDLLAEESDEGLLDPQIWEHFAHRSRRAISGLTSWLQDRAREGAVVAGYGAAAKGNTFLNAVGDAAGTISFVVDGNTEKQGKYLPGSRVPVLAPTSLRDNNVDEVLILPWNLAHEIVPLIGKLRPETPAWVALPEMARLT